MNHSKDLKSKYRDGGRDLKNMDLNLIHNKDSREITPANISSIASIGYFTRQLEKISPNNNNHILSNSPKKLNSPAQLFKNTHNFNSSNQSNQNSFKKEHSQINSVNVQKIGGNKSLQNNLEKVDGKQNERDEMKEEKSGYLKNVSEIDGLKKSDFISMNVKRLRGMDLDFEKKNSANTPPISQRENSYSCISTKITTKSQKNALSHQREQFSSNSEFNVPKQSNPISIIRDSYSAIKNCFLQLSDRFVKVSCFS